MPWLVARTSFCCAASSSSTRASSAASAADPRVAGAASLSAAARATSAAGSVVQSDAWKGYAGLGRAGYGHHPRKLPSGADVDRWLPFSHIVLVSFKRWTLDIFNGVSPAHRQAYLDEYG